jgi:hypothetical protein
MAVKLTAKQEAFALGVVEGKTQAEAYREAYPASREWQPDTVWRRASELMAHREVSGRVEELRASLAKRNEITQDSLVEMVQKAYRIAEEQERAGEMTQAALALAKITGFLDREAARDVRPLRLEYVVPAGADEPVEGEFEEVDDD